MPGIEWISTCDNKDFIRSMNEMTAQVRETNAVISAMGKDASSTMEKMNSTGQDFVRTLKEIGAVAGVSFSIAQAKSFVDKIVETRGYFQDIESSMKVFLGNEQKAQEFTNKLKDYAWYNMFEFSDLANASKQMIAYGHSVDSIIPRLDQLSNVARGTSAPLMEMVNAYNRAKNLGGVGARDLQSWAAKGLVIKDILKEMGEEVKGTSVTFEQLNKVLDHVTGEGGMFHNLMGEQLNNITAEQGQLEDNLTSMYNEIGEKYQDTITGVIKAESWLVDHYKEVGTVIMSLIAAYGEYRAAIVTTNAFKNVRQETVKNLEIELLNDEIAKYKELLPEKEAAKNADLAEAVAKGKLTEKQAALIAAKRAEFEQIQIEKELIGVDEKINELKRLKLDEDLQDKVATEQLTLAQAQEVQQRREVLRSLDDEITKRKEAQIAKIEQSMSWNQGEIKNFQDNSTFYTGEAEKYQKEIDLIDKKISQLEILGGKEKEIADLNDRKTQLLEMQAAANDKIISNTEKIKSLQESNVELARREEEIKMRYGNADEKLDILNNQKISLEQQLVIAQKDAEQKQREYDIVVQTRLAEEDELRVLKEKLAKEQAINEERAKKFQMPNDLSSLSQQVDDQQAVVDALNDETHAKQENSMATAAQEAAEKAQNIQEQINTLEEQANSIATGTNTKAKAANTTATNALTVSEKIHNAALIAGTTASKIFTTAVNQVKTAIKGLGAAIMTNPIGVLVGALTIGLPWLMEWINGTDDAAEMEERYGNEAKEAASKVDSLLSVIKQTDSESKVHKDSVAELERIYKDYGIELEKTKDSHDKEIVTVTELEKKHKDLVDVLRQEAIERQKANDISDANKEYETETEETTKRVKKGLSDTFTKAEKNQLANYLGEKDYERVTEALYKYKKALEEAKETYGDNANRYTIKEYEEYKKALDEAQNKVLELAKAITEDSEAQQNAGKWARWQAERYAELGTEQKEMIDNANKAAAATWKASDAQDANARKIRYAKMSTSELKRELEMMVQAYGNTRLNVTIDFEQTNVPEWMKGMDLKKLKQQSSFWATQAGDMLKKGQKERVINGQKFSAQEVATKANQYRIARSDAEAANEAAEAEAARRAEEAKKNAGRLAQETAARNAKMLQDQWKHEEEMTKLQKDSARAREDASIAAIQSQSERERAEREAQHNRTIADIKAQENDIYKAIYEQRKKTYELNNKDKYENTEEGSKGWQGVKGTLTKEEQKYYDERNNIIKANLQKENAEWGRYEANRIKEQAQSMREYLSQYGTFQQQRLAIAEEYAEKIAEAEKSGNKWEMKKLEAERDTKVAQANAQSLAMNIDWNQTFSGIGNVLQDIAKETLRKVNDYMQTAEFRALGADAKKAYQDLKQQLIDAGGQEASNPFSSKTWDEIAALTKTYQGHVKELAVATEQNAKTAEEYEKAKEKEKNAEVEYAKALEKQRLAKIEGIDTTQADSDVEEARKNLAEASQEVSDSFKRVQETSAAVSDQQANVNNTQQQLHQKTDAAAQGLQNFNTVLGQLTSGTLSGFVEGVSNVINSLTKNTEDDMKGLIGVIGQKAGGIIGAILSIIDMLGDKPVEFFDSLFDGLTNVIKAVISHIPEIIASVIKGIGSMIGGIFEGIGDLFGFGSADNHQEMLDRQEKYNSMLDDSTRALDRFTQELEKSYGALAIQNAEGAEDIIKKNMETIMKGIDSVMWDNYGGGHSDYWHANQALNWSGGELERAGAIDFFKRYGLSVFEESQGQYTWNQLFNGNDPMKLAEAFKDMRDSETNLWRIITTEMGANSGALKEWIEKLIDAYDQIDENQKKMQEQLTTTTSENVFDDFLDSLYNLADGSEDVMDEIADNWQQMVNKMVINNTFGKRVDEFVNGKDGVKGWYERLADLQKQYADNYSDQGYKDAIDVLKKEYSDAIESINTEMDALRDTGLIAPIKEAAEEGKGAFQEMTDSWVSSLMDFDATAEDWAENIGQAMAQKIINEMVVPTLIQPLLDNLQTAFDKAMEENTFTESSGKKAYYWTKVLDNEGLKAAIEDINNAYPELKETVQGIMSMAGIEAKEEFSNSLDGIGDTLIDNLLSLEDDAEDIGKKVGSALIREMIEQMLASGDYAERMEAIRQMWQDVLTGKDTTHTREDVISDLRQLQEDMANDQNMTSLVSEWKDLNKELEKTKQGFSDLRSTITNSLTSAESTIEDFSKSLGKSMMSQMLDAYIDSNYKEEITALSEEWGEALASGNTKALEEIQQKVISLYQTIGNEDIEVKNLTDAIKEIDRALDTTFSSMTDSWVSALMDMEGTAEQFAENVGKTMAQKIITEMVAPIYLQPLLNSMQDAYDSAMDVQGASIESVMNTMSPYLDQVKIVYNEIKPMVEGIFGGFGIYKKAAEEATEEVEYRLGDLKSNFTSALMDMENSAADFSKDISRVLAQNFIENFVLGDRFDQQMDYWKRQYESIIGSGMSEDERKRQLKALRDSIATAKQGYVNSAMAIQELLGITTEDNQEATMNMADKITYDQADQLLGINLAQELTLEQILATIQGRSVIPTFTSTLANEEMSRQVAATLQAMSEVSRAGSDNILMQLATANSHLQLIRDYSKNIRDEVLMHLGSIDMKLTSLRNL